MAFTGRLGTKTSRLGNIVPGIADGLSVGPLGVDVHVLSANEIRARFTLKVTDTALNVDNYDLSSIAPSGTAVTPAITGIRFFDEKKKSVVLTVSPNMTFGTDYSLEVFGIDDEYGDCLVNVAKNFSANVPAPPKPIGAFQSKRRYLDIVFDGPVGPNSSAALFEMRDAAVPGPGIGTVQTPWGSEGIPEDTLRIVIPFGIPPSNEFAINFSGVTDTSLNSASGSVPVTLALRSPAPYSEADLLQLQITDAYVAGGDFEFLRFGIVRVFWNTPSVVDQGNPSSQINLYQSGPHPVTDTVNTITAPDASNLATLITLCTDIKAKFNAHLIEPNIHISNDVTNTITSPVPTILSECVTLLNEAQDRYLAHIANTLSHLYSDVENKFSKIVIGSTNQTLAIAVANLSLKTKFNVHLSSEQVVPFTVVQSGVMNYVTSHSSEGVNSYEVRSAYTYFTDLHVRMSSAEASIRIEANVPSQDTFSSTSSGDFTGSIVARPYLAPAELHSVTLFTDEAVEVRMTGNVIIPNPSSVSITSSGLPIDVDEVYVTSSLPVLASNINFLIVAFNRHRTNGGSGSGHERDDNTNVISSGLFNSDLPSIISAANNLKDALNGHTQNFGGPFHVHADPRMVTSPDATDIQSLFRLVKDIGDTYLLHNSEGPHFQPGYRIYNEILLDTIRIETSSMVDEVQYQINGPIRSSALQIPGSGEIGTPFVYYSVTYTRYAGDLTLNKIDLSIPFIGCATRPALASALPKSGLDFGDDGELNFESDQVEVYFSKPMARVVVDPTNLPITGGSIIQKESDWINDRIVSIRVVNMSAIPYSVVALGLTDVAGNAVI